MEDRADCQVALQRAERFFDLHELQVVVPELHRIGLGQIGTKQISALSATHLFELLAIEAIGEPGTFLVDLHGDKPPRGRDLALRTAELHQERIARELHRLQLREPRPQPLQLAAAHRALLGDPIEALGKHVQFIILRQKHHLHPGAGTAKASSRGIARGD